jgi:selenocysteine lyase/cysteine desulfurase
MVKALDVSEHGVHFGVVQFSSEARVEAPLSGDPYLLSEKIENMIQYMHGTLFDEELKIREEELYKRGKKDTKKIFSFQTDGKDSTNYAQYIQNQKIEIYAVGIGNNVNSTS